MTSLKKHRQDWEDLAELDPMWAVLSAPDKQGNQWKSEDFYAAGVATVERRREALRKLGLPDTFDRVLDFGCGLGRLTYAWADHAKEAVGLDISDAMVQQAAAVARKPNARFVHHPEGLPSEFADGTFDLVFSEICLQHIPSTEAIVRVLRELGRITRSGGVVMFQLPSVLPLRLRFKYRRPLYHLLQKLGFSSAFLLRSLKLNPMKMSHMPSAQVLGIFAGAFEHRATLFPEEKNTIYVFVKR